MKINSKYNLSSAGDLLYFSRDRGEGASSEISGRAPGTGLIRTRPYLFFYAIVGGLKNRPRFPVQALGSINP